MSALPAKHFLDIYETRLGMIEKGTTHPLPKVATGVRVLVAALRELSPEEKIKCDATEERAVFTVASSGALLARIDFK
jgi:hypothetical protein